MVPHLAVFNYQVSVIHLVAIAWIFGYVEFWILDFGFDCRFLGFGFLSKELACKNLPELQLNMLFKGVVVFLAICVLALSAEARLRDGDCEGIVGDRAFFTFEKFI